MRGRLSQRPFFSAYGGRGGSSGAALQDGHGAPAPPHRQACGRTHGWSRWFSQTQPSSSQCRQGILHQAQRQLPPTAGLEAADKVLQALRQLGQLQVAASAQLARDIFGDIARPALGRVERDHTHRVAVLAVEQVGDDSLRSIVSASASRQTRPYFPRSSTTRYAVWSSLGMIEGVQPLITQLHKTEPELKPNQPVWFLKRTARQSVSDVG